MSLLDLQNMRPQLGADADKVIGWSVTELVGGEPSGVLATFSVAQIETQASVIFATADEAIAKLGRSQQSYTTIEVSLFLALSVLALDQPVVFHPEVYPVFYDLVIKHQLPMQNLRPPIEGNWRTIVPTTVDESEGSGSIKL